MGVQLSPTAAQAVLALGPSRTQRGAYCFRRRVRAAAIAPRAASLRRGAPFCFDPASFRRHSVTARSSTSRAARLPARRHRPPAASVPRRTAMLPRLSARSKNLDDSIAATISSLRRRGALGLARAATRDRALPLRRSPLTRRQRRLRADARTSPPLRHPPSRATAPVPPSAHHRQLDPTLSAKTTLENGSRARSPARRARATSSSRSRPRAARSTS